MQPTRNKIIIFLLVIAIQTSKLFSQQTAPNNSVYRLVEIIDSFHLGPDKKVLYRHSFTYDNQGRPKSHTWDYIRNDKMYSSSRMMYNYDNTGRLTSKVSDTVKYAYFYDSVGSLRRITLDLFINNKWTLYEETLIKDEADKSSKNKLVLFIMNKRRYAGERKDSMDMYCKIRYTIDSGNNIIHSKVDAYSYSTYPSPVEYNYTYDSKPNPLQHIFIERWYEYDLEDGGLTNLLAKAKGYAVMSFRMYEYNEAGYPVKCVINNNRYKYFKYDRIEVAVAKPAEALNANEVKGDMTLFPNPASTEVTIEADKLGEGAAQLRISSINGIIYKSVKYQVYNKLQALIPLSGIPKGIYIVQILAPAGNISRKLIIQ